MTLEQQIQLWSAVGTWVAGVATLFAVLVSLHLASRAERVRLKTHAGLRLLFRGDGSPREEHLDISVTNLGERPVTVTTVGWSIGRGKRKRYCIAIPSGPFTQQYPIEIAHGKTANFMVSLVVTPDWLKRFGEEFIRSGEGKYLKTLLAGVHTSVGQTISIRPEPELLERLKKAYDEP